VYEANGKYVGNGSLIDNGDGTQSVQFTPPYESSPQMFLSMENIATIPFDTKPPSARVTPTGTTAIVLPTVGRETQVPFNIEEVDPSCVSVIVKDASGKSVAHPTLMELQLECGR